MSNKTLRLDLNNPKNRALIEKSESGRKGLREYYKGKKINQEVQTHIDHRNSNTKMIEMTESSTNNESNTRLKYGNRICYDELYGTKQKFQSEWERTCWYKLKDCENKGIIHDLKTQIPIKLRVNGHHICTFIIDFRFKYRGDVHYIDAKSTATMPAGARYKVALFRALHEEMLHLAYSDRSSIIEELK